MQLCTGVPVCFSIGTKNCMKQEWGSEDPIDGFEVVSRRGGRIRSKVPEIELVLALKMVLSLCVPAIQEKEELRTMISLNLI
ncbi:hypothetical protein CsSME_00032629 [Camellia sinensis var. sinensis]